jgi:membrane-associated phospholipid phosphatase
MIGEMYLLLYDCKCLKINTPRKVEIKLMTQFERLYQLIKKPWFIASYAVLVILAYLYADKAIAQSLYEHSLREHATILKMLTYLGQWTIYLLLFTLMGVYFRYIKKNAIYEMRSWYLLACIALCNSVGFTLKILLSRARPDLLFQDNLFGFYWLQLNDLYWSFPSGHSITVGAIAAGLGVLFPRCFYAVFALACCVIMTRVLLYFHYLSDVMTGVYLSLLIVGVFTQSIKKHHCLLKEAASV